MLIASVMCYQHELLVQAPVVLMALIDCLAVINGHMLNMHIADILARMREAV